MLINVEQHLSDFDALMDHRTRRATRRLYVIGIHTHLKLSSTDDAIAYGKVDLSRIENFTRTVENFTRTVEDSTRSAHVFGRAIDVVRLEP